MSVAQDRSRDVWRARWLSSKTSPRTRETYACGIDAWFTSCDRIGVDVWDAEAHHGDDYRNTIAALGRTSATINRELSTVSSFYRFVLRRGRPAPIDHNPMELVDRPPPAKSTSSVALEIDETAALRVVSIATNPRTAAVVHLLLGTAARVSEVCGAKVSDLIDTGEDGRRLRVTRKGGVVAEVEIPGPEWAVIERYLTERQEVPGGWLLATTGGRRMSRQTAYRIVSETAWKVTRRTKVGPHDLRRTTATQALSAGEPIQEVQGMLGHASPNTTQIYDLDAARRGRQAARRVSAVYAERAAKADA